MSDIQRWACIPYASDTGTFVDYADHVEALRREFEAGRGYQQERLTNHDMHSGFACLTNYKQGVRDALAGADGYPMIPATECERQVQAARADERERAVQRVEALPPHHGSYAGWLMADEAIAAIKGDHA
jgi:hypothetical protein